MRASAIRVAVVRAGWIDALSALQVAPSQMPYVGDTAFNLRQALDDRSSEAMAVLHGRTPIGFYRLSFAPDTVVGRDLGAPTVGLRAFMLDRAWQGRGHGQAAMRAACADLRHRHPDRALLVLTVNCRNRLAVAAYRKAGCVDTGELFAGGRAGPQHVMLAFLQGRLYLPAPASGMGQ